MTTWTRTVPTEPGYYWHRFADRPGGPWIALAYCVADMRWCFMGDDQDVDAIDLVNDGIEFWPVPIAPPKELS